MVAVLTPLPDVCEDQAHDLFAQHQDLTHHVATYWARFYDSRTHNRAALSYEDFFQWAMLGIWEGLQAFDAGRGVLLAPWLSQHARARCSHVVRDHIRPLVTHEVAYLVIGDDGQGHEYNVADPDPDEPSLLVEVGLRPCDVRAAVQALLPLEGDMVQGVYWLEYTLVDSARRCGIGEGRASVVHAQALAHLGTLLGLHPVPAKMDRVTLWHQARAWQAEGHSVREMAVQSGYTVSHLYALLALPAPPEPPERDAERYPCGHARTEENTRAKAVKGSDTKRRSCRECDLMYKRRRREGTSTTPARGYASRTPVKVP